MGDFNILYLVVDSTSSYKLIKNMKTVNKTICKLNPADVLITLKPATWGIHIPAKVKQARLKEY